jgi:O-antigen/teichoic acid export membrane protein
VDVESRAKGYGRALWTNSVLDLAVWQQSGVFFLWLFVGSNYSGQFSIAYTLTYVLIGLLSGSIVSSLFPEFSKLFGSGDAQRGHSTFRVGFKLSWFLEALVS